MQPYSQLCCGKFGVIPRLGGNFWARGLSQNGCGCVCVSVCLCIYIYICIYVLPRARARLRVCAGMHACACACACAYGWALNFVQNIHTFVFSGAGGWRSWSWWTIQRAFLLSSFFVSLLCSQYPVLPKSALLLDCGAASTIRQNVFAKMVGMLSAMHEARDDSLECLLGRDFFKKPDISGSS